MQKPQYSHQITFRNHGTIRYPVEILIEFEDDDSVREQWNGSYPWIRFEYIRSSQVERVTIDPENRLLIDQNRANNTWVKELKQRADIRWILYIIVMVQNFFQGF